MLRSMGAAISGLRNHQVYMDVVANNISNVNTVGYKSTRANFKEAISQTYRSGSGGTVGGPGGTNPVQVGLGTNLGGIDSMMTQGSLISTGKNTDLAIQGEGFFVLSNGSAGSTGGYYTRDGAFSIDTDGYLVDPVSGYKVMDVNGNAVQIQAAWNWASFSITQEGYLNGILANGTTDTTNRPQIGLVKFPNPEGLVRVGGNLYQAGANSGAAVNAAPLTGGRGALIGGTLEASNVDLAEQFSRMIMAERGFQANSRVITASDEMLQDLVNMKR